MVIFSQLLTMSWLARLNLEYSLKAGRSVARFSHDGPLRVLQSLYPEGNTVCHNVLVHPPSGLVGGDTLDIQVTVGSGSHAMVTTPGATRFYRSEAGLATQQVSALVEDDARLEWLPQEALAYSGCDAINRARFVLAPKAELLTWDITALGLPHSQQPFVAGRFQQHLEVTGIWLERGMIDAQDLRLMNSPPGLAGQRCIATLVFAAGSPIAPDRANTALDEVRATLEASPLRLRSGVTQPNPQVLVLRVLTPVVEPAIQLMRSVWASWRQTLWSLPGTVPRLWNL